MANINSTIKNLNSSSSTTKSTSSSETMVQMNYDGILSICENMNTVIRDIKEQLEEVNLICNNKKNIWRGNASEKFFEDMGKKYNEIYEYSENSIPQYITTVQELVEQNRNTDSQISSSDLESINLKFPTISTISTSTNISTINDSSSANNNINSSNTDESVSTITDETVNSVNVNDNVSSQIDSDFTEVTELETPDYNDTNTISDSEVDVSAMSLEDIIK